jgi:hypothetical protein
MISGEGARDKSRLQSLPQTLSPHPIRFSGTGFQPVKDVGRAPPAIFSDPRGETALLKTFGKFVVLAIFFGVFLWVAAAVAGEKGTVSCSNPGCGYQDNLTIGGAKLSPSVTGYCRSTKKFVRVKLKSWDDYREITPACPDCPEPILPIYNGGDVAEIPCPQCGNLTLQYKRRLFFD